MSDIELKKYTENLGNRLQALVVETQKLVALYRQLIANVHMHVSHFASSPRLSMVGDATGLKIEDTMQDCSKFSFQWTVALPMAQELKLLLVNDFTPESDDTLTRLTALIEKIEDACTTLLVEISLGPTKLSADYVQETRAMEKNFPVLTLQMLTLIKRDASNHLRKKLAASQPAVSTSSVQKSASVANNLANERSPAETPNLNMPSSKSQAIIAASTSAANMAVTGSKSKENLTQLPGNDFKTSQSSLKSTSNSQVNLTKSAGILAKPSPVNNEPISNDTVSESDPSLVRSDSRSRISASAAKPNITIAPKPKLLPGAIAKSQPMPVRSVPETNEGVLNKVVFFETKIADVIAPTSSEASRPSTAGIAPSADSVRKLAETLGKKLDLTRQDSLSQLSDGIKSKMAISISTNAVAVPKQSFTSEDIPIVPLTPDAEMPAPTIEQMAMMEQDHTIIVPAKGTPAVHTVQAIVDYLPTEKAYPDGPPKSLEEALLPVIDQRGVKKETSTKTQEKIAPTQEIVEVEVNFARLQQTNMDESPLHQITNALLTLERFTKKSEDALNSLALETEPALKAPEPRIKNTVKADINRSTTVDPVPLSRPATVAANPTAVKQKKIVNYVPEGHVEPTPEQDSAFLKSLSHANGPELIFVALNGFQLLPGASASRPYLRMNLTTPARLGRSNTQNFPNFVTMGISQVVSRNHLDIWHKTGDHGGTFWIRDTGSNSGTWINGIRLSEPGIPSEEYSVRTGDMIRIGTDYKSANAAPGDSKDFRHKCIIVRVICRAESSNTAYSSLREPEPEALTQRQSMFNSTVSTEPVPPLPSKELRKSSTNNLLVETAQVAAQLAENDLMNIDSPPPPPIAKESKQQKELSSPNMQSKSSLNAKGSSKNLAMKADDQVDRSDIPPSFSLSRLIKGSLSNAGSKSNISVFDSQLQLDNVNSTRSLNLAGAGFDNNSTVKHVSRYFMNFTASTLPFRIKKVSIHNPSNVLDVVGNSAQNTTRDVNSLIGPEVLQVSLKQWGHSKDSKVKLIIHDLRIPNTPIPATPNIGTTIEIIRDEYTPSEYKVVLITGLAGSVTKRVAIHLATISQVANVKHSLTLCFNPLASHDNSAELVQPGPCTISSSTPLTKSSFIETKNINSTPIYRVQQQIGPVEEFPTLSFVGDFGTQQATPAKLDASLVSQPSYAVADVPLSPSNEAFDPSKVLAVLNSKVSKSQVIVGEVRGKHVFKKSVRETKWVTGLEVIEDALWEEMRQLGGTEWSTYCRIAPDDEEMDSIKWVYRKEWWSLVLLSSVLYGFLKD